MFFFIQTDAQSKEGLVIIAILFVFLLIARFWVYINDEVESNSTNVQKKSNSRLKEYTRRNPTSSFAKKKGYNTISNDREELLKSLLKEPHLIWDGLLAEVKYKNPNLVNEAKEKIKRHKEKINKKNRSNGFLIENEKWGENKAFDIENETIDRDGNIYLEVNTDSDSLEITREELIKKYKDLGYNIEIQVSHEEKKRSRRISQKVKDQVWNRDGGKCVECGSNENLEFDHIIPFSKGGANTYRNIQLLCEKCNRTKSDKIG